MKTETSTQHVNPPAAKPLLAAVNWEPRFFAEIDEKQEDGDYLRLQQCCTGCGAFTGDLPGYYYIEDSDACPKCREQSGEEKWSEEVIRIVTRQKMDKSDIDELKKDLSEYVGI